MKSLRALPILLLALTTASGYPPQKPKESSDKTKASSDRPKEFRELLPAEPPKIDPKSIPEHPLSIKVRIDTEDRLYLNNELVGTVEDTGELKKRLRRVFKEKRRLLDSPEGARIGETERKNFKKSPGVVLEAHRSVKYGTVVKIIDVLKAEGCTIGLVIDDVSP